MNTLDKAVGKCYLVGDVGGTNVRLALIDETKTIRAMQHYLCTDFPDPAAAIQFFFAELNRPVTSVGAIAIANPILGDQLSMTNAHWQFSIEATQIALGMKRLLFINDFTALAWSLPLLKQTELHQVGEGSPVAGTPMAVLGPGTGLGVSALIPCGPRWVPLQGEGGHVTYSPVDERERALLAIIQREYPHISAERLISGMGLENLYRAIAELDQQPRPPLLAAHISEAALKGTDQVAVAALESFCAMLGTVAGNLALTLGARGGVYIAGGIIPKLGDFFVHSLFRQRFLDKGRMRVHNESIPTYVIHAACPALLGAASALEEALLN